MPSVTLEISVSRREGDRPRLLQITAFDANGVLEGLSLHVTAGTNGSLRDEAELRHRDLVTGRDGLALFQWYGWPRNGPARDFTSTVTASWQNENAIVFLDNLFD